MEKLMNGENDGVIALTLVRYRVHCGELRLKRCSVQ